MRWLTGLVMLLGCLWGGYWFVGERGFEAAAKGWFATLQDSGKVAEYSDLSVQGFPNRFDLTVTDPHFADPATGFNWQAPFFQVLSLSYKPWHVIAAFPPEQRLVLPREAMTIRSGKLQASVVAKPQTSLPLDRLAVVGQALEVVGDKGWTVKAETVQFATRLDESRAHWHEVGLNLGTLTPDAGLTALFGGVLPAQIALIRLDAHVELTAPLDRTALAAKPQIAAVELDDLRIDWGTMGVAVTGSIVADAAGFAEGDAVLRLENWRVALDVAQATGLLAPDQRRTWERAAQFLAKSTDGVDTLELPLRFANGLTLIGPLPVGPAPRLR
ncbi:DUF2125 domain-containing protein [Pseudorhodobacter ferrugineus]|uniref:DUF2125 domain-containing protein n=1 Tax=Pseudorhodobacter ferrugineus TaxID=77008 RepID=UPI0003F999E5|nr:DUF2125 domain-containing protein [Pseudorhodobacter ferrugineus]